jgi:2'-5' RNA ligase
MANENLYLWAVVPPSALAEQIDGIRKEFSENFQCFRALKPPVHVTLYKPFKLPDADMEYHIARLRHLVSIQTAFTMELKNFSFFENSRTPVLLIDVLPNEHLKALNTAITRETKKLFAIEDLSKDRFHPHFTIGYRDVTPEIFPQVKQAYRSRPFTASFEAAHVTLFRHSGTNWQVKHELPLDTKSKEQGSLW